MNKKRNHIIIVFKFKNLFQMQSPIYPKWVGKNNEEILYSDAYTVHNSENEH